MIRVLVVEDSRFMRGVINTILSRDPDIEVVGSAADGLEAVDAVSALRPDVVTMDVDMPRADGLSAVERIMSERPTPIVMITGDEDRNAMMRAFQAGATFFLSKPVDRPRLMRLIRATEGFMQQEKRRFQRVKVSCKVSIESNKAKVIGSTLDLSLNGMLVQAHRTFPVGSSVQACLELAPKAPQVCVAARVVRVSAV